MSSNQSNENTINNAQDPLAAALPDRPMTDSYYKAKSFMDVVVEQTQAVRRARRVRIQRSDEDRIRLGIAERCSKCERVISKKEDQDCGVSNNLKQHKERDICHNIFSAKRLAIRVGVADISLYQNIINTIRKWAIKTGKWSPNRRRFYE